MKSTPKFYVLSALVCLLFLPHQLVQAGEYYSAVELRSLNMTQNKHNVQQLELSEGQVRSRVEHTLINYLLGHVVDEYLDLGVEDEATKKNTTQLKIRINEHHLILMYHRSLN